MRDGLRRLFLLNQALWLVACLCCLMAACNRHHNHRDGILTPVVPCPDGDNASPTGEGHHDFKPCEDED